MVGSAHADDGCEMTGQICNYPLETVFVEGFYSPTSVSGAVPEYYILPNGNMLSSIGWDGVVRYATTPLPSVEVQARIQSCVSLYGKYGVNPAYPITYKQFYTWMLPGSNIHLSGPQTTGPNSGDHWVGVAGVTHGTTITIYEQGWGTSNYGTFQAIFDTVAHEESHAFGVADEGQAEADAQAAWAAFAADNGARCGGPL
ncbi:hypothetical protein KPL74_08960 [Bacillus sp. NP157]|nr:hypothetical protein KPL74_08960 [Bacillus sp. NP157]